MEKINKLLVNRLANEERTALHKFTSEISSEEFDGALLKMEMLTQISLVGEDFDPFTMSVLGVDNCCNYFKALCEQYLTLKSKGLEVSRFEAYSKKAAMSIGFSNAGLRERECVISLADTADKIDEVIRGNYKELQNGVIKIDDDIPMYNYAQVGVFADVYYAIRDCIEGKDYFDSKIMPTKREISRDLQSKSELLMNEYCSNNNVSREKAREHLIRILNQGIDCLTRLPQYVAKTELNKKHNSLPEDELFTGATFVSNEYRDPFYPGDLEESEKLTPDEMINPGVNPFTGSPIKIDGDDEDVIIPVTGRRI